MEQLIKNGRPRLYPPCERYGAHRFSPKTGRCPCGYERPGSASRAKDRADASKPVRIAKTLLERLERVSKGKSVGKMVKIALEKFLFDAEYEQANVDRK
jgi:hypothetical protein